MICNIRREAKQLGQYDDFKIQVGHKGFSCADYGGKKTKSRKKKKRKRKSRKSRKHKSRKY